MTFLYLTDFLIPIMLIAIGVLWKVKPPQTINGFYGYRTGKSMASQEAWDLAHKLSGQYSLKTGIILLPIVILARFFIPLDSDILILINLGLGILGLVIQIPLVERKLPTEKRFQK